VPKSGPAASPPTQGSPPPKPAPVGTKPTPTPQKIDKDAPITAPTTKKVITKQKQTPTPGSADLKETQPRTTGVCNSSRTATTTAALTCSWCGKGNPAYTKPQPYCSVQCWRKIKKSKNKPITVRKTKPKAGPAFSCYKKTTTAQQPTLKAAAAAPPTQGSLPPATPMVSPQESARLPEKEANNDQKEEEEEEKETKKKDMFLCEGGSYKAEGEFEDPSRSKLRISLSREGAKLMWSDVITSLVENKDFRSFFNSILSKAPYKGYFWECNSLTQASITSKKFEMVLVRTNYFKFLHSNGKPFEGFIDSKNGRISVVRFANKGGDALMVVPTHHNLSEVTCKDLASFVRGAPESQQDMLWKSLGRNMSAMKISHTLWKHTHSTIHSKMNTFIHTYARIQAHMQGSHS